MNFAVQALISLKLRQCHVAMSDKLPSAFGRSLPTTQRRESISGRPGGKRGCFLCAMPSIGIELEFEIRPHNQKTNAQHYTVPYPSLNDHHYHHIQRGIRTENIERSIRTSNRSLSGFFDESRVREKKSMGLTFAQNFIGRDQLRSEANQNRSNLICFKSVFFFLFFVENDSSIYFVFSFFFQMSPNSNRSQSFNKTFWQKGKTRKEEEKEKSLILKWIVLSKEKRPWAVLGASFHFPSQTNFTVFLKRLISFQELAI